MTELETLTNKINELESKIAELENKNKTAIEQCVECEICHKTFKNKYILKAHIKNIHSDNHERFECPHCQKQLKSKYYLQYHISHIHNEKQ